MRFFFRFVSFRSGCPTRSLSEWERDDECPRDALTVSKPAGGRAMMTTLRSCPTRCEGRAGWRVVRAERRRNGKRRGNPEKSPTGYIMGKGKLERKTLR